VGRRAEGIRFLKRGGIWTVRFRHAGRRHEYSTGVATEPTQRKPSEDAIRAGEQIYAAALQRKRVVRAGAVHYVGGAHLAELLEDWLGELHHREATRSQYDVYAVQWLREWRLLRELTEASIAAYFRRRLREVTRKSASNEVSALRGFARWALEVGHLDAPIFVPALPESALGTPYAVRRRVRAPELSPDEVEGILSRLPERSGEGRGFPVRARFEVMWETTLRPATLDRLSVPEHWAPGEDVIRVTAAIDKEGNAREVPLSARALAALERVAPANGAIFGAHNYRPHLGPAAAAVLPASKAAIFTGQHVRSAAITRALERSGNLPGVMHLAGHTQAATTSKYIRPTLRAANDVLAALAKVDP